MVTQNSCILYIASSHTRSSRCTSNNGEKVMKIKPVSTKGSATSALHIVSLRYDADTSSKDTGPE